MTMTANLPRTSAKTPRLAWGSALGLSLAVLMAASPALAQPTVSATETVRQANASVSTILRDKGDDPNHVSAAVMKTLHGLFDIPFLTQRALVDHWAAMTPAQRTDMVKTLTQIMEKNYVRQLRGNLDYKVTYPGEEKVGEDTLVHTVIHATQNGRVSKIEVDYLLHPVGQEWRIFDVVTETVSIVQNYRSQFNRIIAKDGFAGLLKRMKAKLAAQGS